MKRRTKLSPVASVWSSFRPHRSAAARPRSSRALADHEHDRAVGFFQDRGRGFAEEQLLAGATLDADHNEIVLALLGLLENGVVRGVFGPYRGLGIDVVALAQRDDVVEHG